MIKEINNTSTREFSKRLEYIVDNKTIGYLDYSLIYDRIEIDNIYVLEEYRNQKIATLLMEYLDNIAQRENSINITLEVRQSNYVAIHLYEKMGFTKVAIRKYYYGDEDAILMEKKVK